MYPKLKSISFLLLMLMSCSIVLAQQRTLSGTIINRETREHLVGATVSIKGSDKITMTDTKGAFSIPVTDESVLKISMVGYLNQEIPVGKQTSVDIGLQSDKKQMDEVVVIGYGQQK